MPEVANTISAFLAIELLCKFVPVLRRLKSRVYILISLKIYFINSTDIGKPVT